MRPPGFLLYWAASVTLLLGGLLEFLAIHQSFFEILGMLCLYAVLTGGPTRQTPGVPTRRHQWPGRPGLLPPEISASGKKSRRVGKNLGWGGPGSPGGPILGTMVAECLSQCWHGVPRCSTLQVAECTLSQCWHGAPRRITCF